MPDRNILDLGVDVGSVGAKVVVMDAEGRVLEDVYRRVMGKPVETTIAILDEMVAKYGPRLGRIAFTGSGGKMLAKAMGAASVNEVVAQARAEAFFHPEVRTVIEIGGEDSKLILLKEESGKVVIDDFAMNSVCAAGTGSFLDQQAARLGVKIEEEFGRLAMKSVKPPRIAGRCTVFAKSDMIHLQQKATPDYDIIAGLCFALARNFKSNVCRGREFTKPIAFQGGVAANAGVVRAFTEILELQPGELVIPKHFASMGAIGAVLERRDTGAESLFRGTAPLREFLKEKAGIRRRLSPLPKPEGSRLPSASCPISPIGPSSPIPVFLGIDVGSISTKVVAIDRDRRVLAKAYLMTAGRPLEAVRDGLRIVGGEIADRVSVVGVGATGSGRYLIGDFVGADVVRNEITAQATAAIHIDPSVDTIFEIGGQDSKYISIDNGVVVDFQMNHVCAAGTGSFLEEQAEKLGVSIKKEFAAEALACPSPVRLGERCTVFMESDIVLHQQTGASRDELVSGLCYSIVQNYLNRVVGTRRVGKRIFFQGGTAFNDGVVSAFRAVTGKDVVVPPDHEVTGAIGAAILAAASSCVGGDPCVPPPSVSSPDNKEGGHIGPPLQKKSRFRGFDLSERKYELKRLSCTDCANECEINEVILEGEAPLYYGSRCDKFNLRRKSQGMKKERDLFRRREELLTACLKEDASDVAHPASGVTASSSTTQQQSHPGAGVPHKPNNRRGRAGIPRALVQLEMLPFWHAFLKELGYEVVVSPVTHRGIITKGVEAVSTETCFPVKVAHGHVLELLERGVDLVLLPSLISGPSEFEGQETSVFCPYVQSIPYVIRAAIDFPAGVELVTFPVRLEYPPATQAKEIAKSCRSVGWKRVEIERALRKGAAAQHEFRERCREEGRKLLSSLTPADRPVAVFGRPYNGCDRGVNLDLPRKLHDLGMLPVPIDFLPLEPEHLDDEPWDNLYWRYGQKIMGAANFVASHPLFAAVYLTNFSCGPDSFLTTFFRKAMGKKPALLLEIDEHSADAGVITRLEAFLDSLSGARDRRTSSGEAAPKLASRLNGRRLWVPNMCDHAYAFAAAFRAGGLDCEVLPPSDEASLELGRRWTTGKECLPAIVTAGDMLRMVLSPGFERDKNAFFMPTGTGPCRFGQYNRLHRYLLKELGYEDVPIISPNQGLNFYADFRRMEKDCTRAAWQGMVVVDMMLKALHRIRPYEVTPGSADRAYASGLGVMVAALESGAPLEPAVRRIVAGFAAVETAGERRPVVGVVGEIYVRSHAFSNANVIATLESLGAEASLASFSEWIFYTNIVRVRRSRRDRDFLLAFKDTVKNWVQKMDERRIGAVFLDILDQPLEPPSEKVLKCAAPYIHESFEGEAVLSVGRTVEFFHERASGVVNVMPFTCMPGAVVSSVLKSVREDHDQMPVVSLSYDGQTEGSTLTRLEAFMHQVKAFHRRRAKRHSRKRAAATVS